MKRETNIIFRIAFGIVAAIVIIGVFATDKPDSPFAQMKIKMVISTLGSMVALFSALLILIRAAEGVEALRLLPLGFGLLGGVLMATGNGVVALAFAIAIAAVLGRDAFAGQRPAGNSGVGGGGHRSRRRSPGGGEKEQK